MLMIFSLFAYSEKMFYLLSYEFEMFFPNLFVQGIQVGYFEKYYEQFIQFSLKNFKFLGDHVLIF